MPRLEARPVGRGEAVAAQELREAHDFPVVEYEVKGQTKGAE